MPRERSSERTFVTLAGVCLALFVALVCALVTVQSSMAREQRRLAEIILPIQDDVSSVQGAIAEALAGEALLVSPKGLAERSEEWKTTLRDVQARLQAHMVELQDPGELRLASDIEPASAAFVEADDALYASHARSAALDHDFQEALQESFRDLDAATEMMEGIEGHTKLAYILLLRRLALPADLRELRSGEIRARDEAARDLLGSFRRYGGLVGRFATVAGPDALRSTMANELPQARARVLADLEELGELTAHDPELSSRVQAARGRFDRLDRTVGTFEGEKSLPSFLLSRFATHDRSVIIHRASREAAARLLEAARVLHRGARGIAERAGAEAQATLDRVRVASAIVVALALAGCAFAARRFLHGFRALRATNANLSRLRRELTDSNGRLEGTVARRTDELRSRERSLQLVLDATGDGLAAVAPSGAILGERSKAVSAWFGEPAAGAKLWDLLYRGDARAAAGFACSWEQLVSDVFPFEVAADQMPRAVARDGRELELDFKPVCATDGQLVSVLVVIRDVTATRAAQRAEGLARERQAVLSAAVGDPRGFRRSLVELGSLVNGACDAPDEAGMRRALHTLKGNAASFGLALLATACDALETALDGRDGGLSPDEKDALRASWRTVLSGIDEAIGVEALELLDVSRAEWKRLRAAVERGVPHQAILQQILRWEDEPAARPLRRLGTQASQLAQRLGKSLQVVVWDGGVRLDAQRFAPVWGSLVHAVRNAVDHGIETPERREAGGKSGQAYLELTAAEDPLTGTVSITVRDDGAGLNFAALRAAAQRRGLPSETDADLLEALFHDGVTTRTEANEISGRGVGMSALRHACRALGGRVEITTAPGQGTTVQVSVPRGSAGNGLSDDTLSFRRRRRDEAPVAIVIQGAPEALTEPVSTPFFIP